MKKIFKIPSFFVLLTQLFLSYSSLSVDHGPSVAKDELETLAVSSLEEELCPKGPCNDGEDHLCPKPCGSCSTGSTTKHNQDEVRTVECHVIPKVENISFSLEQSFVDIILLCLMNHEYAVSVVKKRVYLDSGESLSQVSLGITKVTKALINLFKAMEIRIKFREHLALTSALCHRVSPQMENFVWEKDFLGVWARRCNLDLSLDLNVKVVIDTLLLEAICETVTREFKEVAHFFVGKRPVFSEKWRNQRVAFLLARHREFLLEPYAPLLSCGDGSGRYVSSCSPGFLTFHRVREDRFVDLEIVSSFFLEKPTTEASPSASIHQDDEE